MTKSNTPPVHISVLLDRSGSMSAIASDIGLAPADILFLSDIEGELDAARSAGMQTLWLVRDAEPDPAAAHRQVKDFDAIPLP